MVIDNSKLSVAYHEAGHAVVIVLLGGSLSCLRLEKDPGKCWRGGTTPAGEPFEPQRSVLIVMAGFACDRAYARHQSLSKPSLSDFLCQSRYGSDRKKCWEIQKSGSPVCDQNSGIARPHETYGVISEDGDDEMNNKVIALAAAKAGRLLNRSGAWDAVSELAAQLSNQLTVSGSDAMEIIGRHIGLKHG